MADDLGLIPISKAPQSPDNDLGLIPIRASKTEAPRGFSGLRIPPANIPPEAKAFGLGAGSGITYNASRFNDAYKNAEDEAAAAHPNWHMAGQLVGAGAGAAVGPEALALRAIAPAVKGASLGARALSGAGRFGASAGLGQAAREIEPVANEGQTIGGAAKDVALATGLGGSLGAAVPLTKAAGGALKSQVFNQLEHYGVPMEEAKTYASNLPEINKGISSYGDNTSAAADDFRSKALDLTKAKKAELYSKVAESVKDPNAPLVNMNSTIKSLEEAKARVPKRLFPEDNAHIEELQNRIKDMTNKTGHVDAQTAFDIKEMLQENSKYQQNGKLFTGGDKSSAAARNAARAARTNLDEAIPAMKDANSTLSQLHEIEDQMNRGILKEGAPEASVLATGQKIPNQGTNRLKELGDIVGHDLVGDAKKLVAQKRFANPAFFSKDNYAKAYVNLADGIKPAQETVPGVGLMDILKSAAAKSGRVGTTEKLNLQDMLRAAQAEQQNRSVAGGSQ